MGPMLAFIVEDGTGEFGVLLDAWLDNSNSIKLKSNQRIFGDITRHIWYSWIRQETIVVVHQQKVDVFH